MNWKSGINLLPVETLEQIFSWLDDDDLIAVSSVCKRWYHIVNLHVLHRKRYAILRPEVTDYKPEHPLRRLSLIEFDSKQIEEVGDIVSNLRQLHIGYDGPENSSIDEKALNGLFSTCAQLDELSLKNVTISDKAVRAIIRNFKINKLSSLTLECFDLEKDRIKYILDTFLFTELKLIVRRSRVREAILFANYPFAYNTVTKIELPKHITHLRMDCSGLTKNCYRSLKFCRNLKSLELLHAFSIEDNAIAECLANLLELNKISLSDAKNVTNNGWKSLFNCANIRDVSLVRCVTGLSDLVFEDAKAALSRLDLDLQNCKRVTEEGVISAIGLTETISLTLDYNEKLLQCLEKFVVLGNAPRLRYLDIAVQRLNATSFNISSHLNGFKSKLSSYFDGHGYHFNFKELFTSVERNHQSIMPINNTDEII